MKLFFELGDRYAMKSDWKDFALTKFCLCAMGVLLGIHVPQKHRKTVGLAALAVFTATYIPLMSKIYSTAKEMYLEKKASGTSKNG